MSSTFLSSTKDNLREKLRNVWEEHILGNTDDTASEPAPVMTANALLNGDKRQNIHRIADSLHGIHNMLKYDMYDDQRRLFYNDNSISFCFEVIPQTGADENMVARLMTLFAPIPPGFGVQWTLFGSPILEDQLQNYLDLRHIAVDKGLKTPFFLELAQRRVKHLRQNVGQPIFKNDSYVIKNIRLIFSVTKAGKFTDTRLINEMLELRDTLEASLRSSQMPCFAMDANDLIHFLWPIMNPHCLFEAGGIPELEYDQNKSIKDQVTAFGHHARVKSDHILFGLPPENEDEKDTRIAVRALGVLKYPKKKELWEMANIIGHFFDPSLQYPCPFLISGGVFTLDPTKTESRAQFKAIRTTQNATSKMASFQPALQIQQQDWKVVAHQLDKGGSLCEMVHTLLLFSPVAGINKAAQIATNIWRNERFTMAPLRSLHLGALYASLPMTLTGSLRDDLFRMRVMATKTTVNAVDLAPIMGEWRGAGDPVMMFFGRRGTPTFLDFYSNKQGNYNVFVTGVSGSGKSVTMNEIVSAYAGVGAKICVIDVGRSYQNMIDLAKGRNIVFTPSSNICVNAFSNVGMDKELDFKDELRLLKPMIGRMASPNTPLNEFQYSIIEEAITGVWNDYGQDANPTLIQRYLLEKIKNESGQTERVAFELGKQIQPFTDKGIYGRYFNGRANLTLDEDIIGLELEELKSAPDLRRVMLFMLTTRITSDMYLMSRERMKLCLIDEAWQLLGSDKETADFIEEGYRRARKYNGCFCVGTQGIEDAYKNDASKAAYTNADWKIYLRQDRDSVEKLIAENKLNFPPAIKRQLLSLCTESGRYSEMLISSPNGKAIVRHIPDPFSLLMASTNAQDYTECQGLLDKGHSAMQAIEIMLERRRFNH